MDIIFTKGRLPSANAEREIIAYEVRAVPPLPNQPDIATHGGRVYTSLSSLVFDVITDMPQEVQGGDITLILEGDSFTSKDLDKFHRGFGLYLRATGINYRFKD